MHSRIDGLNGISSFSISLWWRWMRNFWDQQQKHSQHSFCIDTLDGGISPSWNIHEFSALLTKLTSIERLRFPTVRTMFFAEVRLPLLVEKKRHQTVKAAFSDCLCNHICTDFSFRHARKLNSFFWVWTCSLVSRILMSPLITHNVARLSDSLPVPISRVAPLSLWKPTIPTGLQTNDDFLFCLCSYSLKRLVTIERFSKK